MESAAELNVPEFGDAAHCRAALHISVSSPAKEATQIVGAARVAEIPGAAPVVKEAAEKAARVADTSGAAPVVKEAAENAVGVS